MAGCEWSSGCRCRAGMTGCLLRAGMVRGRVMGCPGRGLRLGRAGVPGRLAGRVWVMRGWGPGLGMVRGGRWCGRMR